MSLTNPNKPVTEARLQEFYHRIKNFLGFTEMPSEDMSDVVSPIPGVMNKLPVLFDETGAEYQVGWYKYADGTKKPVYEKSLIIMSPSSKNTWTTRDHNISNIDNIINYEGLWKKTENDGYGYYLLNASFYSNISPTLYAGVNNTVISLYVDDDRWVNVPISITVRYTKTTDTPQ